jgi:hypothetical protein
VTPARNQLAVLPWHAHTYQALLHFCWKHNLQQHLPRLLQV